MSINPVNLTDTFDVWRTTTNQIIGLTSETTSNVSNVSNIASAAFVQANNVGGAVTTANTNIVTAHNRANSAFTQANLAFVQANTATTIGSAAFGQANTATTIGSAAFGQANTATTIGSSAFNQANNVGGAVTTANNNIVTAHNRANSAFTQANLAFVQANTATTIGSAAFNQANIAAPTITVDTVNATRYITYANNTTGFFSRANVDSLLTYNPSTRTLTANNLSVTRSLGVGTAPSTTTGEIRATDNITAYFSDKRLKTIISQIPNALAKLNSLTGIIYVNNDVAESFGYKDKGEQVGVIAQEVEDILPQIVKLAPFDTEYIDGVETSRSGENYKTVQYEKLIPLLIEAIKEQQEQIDTLKQEVSLLKVKN